MSEAAVSPVGHDMAQIDKALDDGFQALATGDLAATRRFAASVLEKVPRHPAGLYLSGVALAIGGDPVGAIPQLEAAIAVGGGTPECYYNLGLALHRVGDSAGAERAYWSAILRAPGFAEAYNSLGVTLADCGRTEDAIAAFRRAGAERPDFAEARHNLAGVLIAAGRADAAFDLYRDWLACEPGNQRLIFLAGTAALNADMLEEAESLLRQFLLHRPRDAGALNNLGLALSRTGRISDAIATLSRAVDLQPDYKEAWFALAAAHQAAGQFTASAEAYERVRDIGGSDLGVDSNILMALNYYDTLTAAEVYDRHRRWGEDYARNMPADGSGDPPQRPPAQPRDGRRLRIGYVSPDFRLHSVSMFLLPLLEHHDRSRVELFAYSNVEKNDVITDTVRRQVDGWRSMTGLSAADGADLIRHDGVDVLIDLAGHTARHRLDVFALRPAPVQATWLGYPATTGLTAVDARFTDAVADPVGDADRLHTETLVRLDHFLCYRPLGSVPAPLPAPALSRRTVSFGSFNTLPKLNAATAALWARVLRAVPDSRLVLKTALLADRGVRERVRAMFTVHGIDDGRIVLLSHIPNHFGHLDAYGEIDIALDPTPYNGATTTCEALWMGVPVLTLPGDRHAARVGASLLTAAGLTEWIARDADDFVAMATAMASDPQRLAENRAGLRGRLLASPLCDGARFARQFEARCFGLRAAPRDDLPPAPPFRDPFSLN
ncbi:tetratricopeptide repeat protein [Azospirillum sp.]|uniref:O-linked N-acetylglucosamine transferase, SPINDLY family protein n=1 Tax=Azospirillum sp. TaxID=34012 RepID=UPI002623FE9A|nr:tetratricopeptide repeat protein [Azospirillum sp.]